jgi:uncharacterized protein
MGHTVPEGFRQISYRTDDGLDIHAGYHPAVPGMPTLLFFHGNSIDWQSTEVTIRPARQQGSGVATQLASEVSARALMLISPFKSMAATAANKYPYIPVNWLLTERFDNIAKIGRVTVPGLGHNMAGMDEAQVPQVLFLESLR